MVRKADDGFAAMTAGYESKSNEFGALNPHSISIVMRDVVRRGMEYITQHLTLFEAHGKTGGKENDIFTTVDTDVQALMVKILRECFPGFGILAEEKNDGGLHWIEQPHGDLYFTLDPLCGTKAFVRGQTGGIATTLALMQRGVKNGNPCLAAYIGNVMSGDVYGYRPGSELVHRIHPGRGLHYVLNTRIPAFPRSRVLLREPPERTVETLLHGREHTEETLRKLHTLIAGDRDYVIDDGSIGLSIIRLANKEVTSMVWPAGRMCPWDVVPVFAIALKMGMVVEHLSTTGDFEWIPNTEHGVALRMDADGPYLEPLTFRLRFPTVG